MGFALWIKGDFAYAQGTHEYRPMGTAVIGTGGIFTPRDFRRARRAPQRTDPALVGLFASLGDMNDWLKKRQSARSRSQQQEKNFRRHPSLGPPIF